MSEQRSCLICKFTFSPDDLVTVTGPSTGLCLVCFEREMGDRRRLPARMAEDVARVLAAITPSNWLKDE